MNSILYDDHMYLVFMKYMIFFIVIFIQIIFKLIRFHIYMNFKMI